MTVGATPPAEYELTIGGGLGPVLQNALGPDLAARTRTCTTLVAESAIDLSALVVLLDSLGLRIESVFILDPSVATL